MDSSSIFPLDGGSKFPLDCGSMFPLDSRSKFPLDSGSKFPLDSDSKFPLDSDSKFPLDSGSKFPSVVGRVLQLVFHKLQPEPIPISKSTECGRKLLGRFGSDSATWPKIFYRPFCDRLRHTRVI